MTARDYWIGRAEGWADAQMEAARDFDAVGRPDMAKVYRESSRAWDRRAEERKRTGAYKRKETA